MTVLAYTTTVPIRSTIAAIDDVLTKYGAHNVTKLGPSKAPTGIGFDLETELGLQTFRLPVNPDRVQKKLKAQYDQGGTTITKKETTPEHVERVAWRQLLRWLESHLAAIDGGLFTAAQLMTPFLEIRPGVSVYELLGSHPERLALSAGR
jgi:hypothetical protein